MNNIKGFFNLLSYFDLLSLELIIILKLFVLKSLLMDGIKFLNYCPLLLKIFAIFLFKILLWHELMKQPYRAFELFSSTVIQILCVRASISVRKSRKIVCIRE